MGATFQPLFAKLVTHTWVKCSCLLVLGALTSPPLPYYDQLAEELVLFCPVGEPGEVFFCDWVLYRCVLGVCERMCVVNASDRQTL